MISQTKNHSLSVPFYRPRREGGKRAEPSAAAHRRLVDISTCKSGALRRRKLPGVNDEGWAPMRNVPITQGILQISASAGDIYEIVGGGDDNGKLRFELEDYK